MLKASKMVDLKRRADLMRLADARCSIETPALREMGPGHRVACHYS